MRYPGNSSRIPGTRDACGQCGSSGVYPAATHPGSFPRIRGTSGHILPSAQRSRRPPRCRAWLRPTSPAAPSHSPVPDHSCFRGNQAAPITSRASPVAWDFLAGKGPACSHSELFLQLRPYSHLGSLSLNRKRKQKNQAGFYRTVFKNIQKSSAGHQCCFHMATF